MKVGDKMSIAIETATIADFDEVNSIVKESQEEHHRALPHIFSRVDQVMPHDYFQSLLIEPVSEVLVLRINNQIIGFAVLEVIEAPPFDSLTPRKYAYVNDFGVKKSHKRMGLGKILFEECMCWANSKGATALELNVWDFNEGAITFYESLGMKTISRKMTISLNKETEN